MNYIVDRPPARYCDGAELVLFEPYGVCDENEFCHYAEERHACIEPCVNALCGEDDVCTWVICNKPPASYCHDDSVLRVYDREGFCEGGFCSYVYSDITCKDDCVEGRCVNDPCIEVSCDDPPPNQCIDGNLITWDVNSGTCVNGVCSYEETLEFCPRSLCADGRCADDLCAGIVCSSPPAPYCLSDNILVDYPTTGTCNPDSGYCTYETQESTCGVRCENGECLEVIDETTELPKDLDIGAAIGHDAWKMVSWREKSPYSWG